MRLNLIQDRLFLSLSREDAMPSLFKLLVRSSFADYVIGEFIEAEDEIKKVLEFHGPHVVKVAVAPPETVSEDDGTADAPSSGVVLAPAKTAPVVAPTAAGIAPPGSSVTLK